MANIDIPRDEFMAGWLSGFFDGEGSAVLRATISKRNPKRHTRYYLSVCNTDLSLMQTAVLYLNALGIGHGKYYQHSRTCKKPLYLLHICKAKDIKRFAEKVRFNSAEKQATLECMLKWITQPRNSDKIKAAMAKDIASMRMKGFSFRKIATALGYAEGSHSNLSELLRLEEERWK